MPDFVLEIGTEEVPAAAVVPALAQLDTLTRDLLSRERLGFRDVRTLGTPRRLVVYVTELAEQQEDAVVQQRGPAKRAAFDTEGNPTKAAEGFARRYGLTPADLQVRETDGGEYVYAEQRVDGKPAAGVLAAAIPGLLTSLAFPKFMRWGEGQFRFSRPIRWITALHGAEVVPVEAGGVAAGRESFGHRFLPVVGTEDGHRVRIERAEEYFERMRDARVVVDAEERRNRIVEQGNALASADGVQVVWDPDLLHEVTYVVEYPTAFVGRFSEEYLALPRPVLVSAMRKHQRYFTLEHEDGSLAPRFLAVRNGGEEGLEIVREGNERCLFFRFNDAVHHDTEDRKTTLEQEREELKRIVFIEKMGTMWDKSERLRAVAGHLCGALGQDALRARADQAAALCKADLASHMVAELPELQGIIGREYALREGLDPDVAEAIGEHYQPKAAGDPVPGTLLGRLLSLADRLDLLVAAFSLGHVPTGSSDPFGLRRAAAGVVALLQELPQELSLSVLLDGALAALAAQPFYERAVTQPLDDVKTALLHFIRPRVEAVLEDAGARPRLVEAVLDVGFDSIPRTLARARYLQARAADPANAPVFTAGMRVRNILKPGDAAPAAGDLSRLEHETEKTLLREIGAREPALQAALDGDDWDAAWGEWDALRPAVDRFFDDVMVNVEDADLRAARHTVLRRLDRTFTRLADFSKVPFDQPAATA